MSVMLELMIMFHLLCFTFASEIKAEPQTVDRGFTHVEWIFKAYNKLILTTNYQRTIAITGEKNV